MFNSPTFQSYYLQVDRAVRDQLAKEKPEYLLQVDFEEFLTHLVEKYSWEEFELDEGGMTMEPFIGRARINDFGEIREVDRPRVRLRIPVSPHSQRREFLELKPSTQRGSGEPAWTFQGNTLILECEGSEEAIKRSLDEARFWIGGRNNDVRSGNARLRQQIEPILRLKRQELQAHNGALKELTDRVKIPLHQSASAPKPVQIHKATALSPRPALMPGTPEPELDRRSVLEIVDFVETYSRQLEVTPGVYSKLEEEELRDLVLSMLNVNYPGSTGETFSKQGKTDLFLRDRGGGGSLIVECKRWGGAKKHGEALGQLFGYLTWRHSFGVLLTFSTNRNMSACIEAAREVVARHSSTVPSSVNGASSRFSSRHLHPQDRAKEVEVFHLFADLAVPSRT